MNINKQVSTATAKNVITLDEGLFIEESLYDMVLPLVVDRLPLLHRDQVYQLETLLGDMYLSFLKDEGYEDLDIIELCVKHIAKYEDLPVITLIRGHREPRIYILK